jgi:uroporphyrinogen-III decarboxylase
VNKLYDERLARIKKAVALEAVDKILIVPCANAYFARSQGVLLKDYISNIRKAKAMLGDMMCILGDVPAELLAFGSSEEVYRYASRLIVDIGPAGYILASGCDIPANEKKENVKAMVDAANQANIGRMGK